MCAVYRFLLLAALISAGFAGASVLQFRLDGDRLWLTAENEPLPQLLERFTRAGVRVELDPELENTVTGSWSGDPIEAVFDAMLPDCDYLLDWQRDTAPHGDLIRLTGLRVFRKGDSASAQPLRAARRVETSMDGAERFMAREILIGFGPGSTLADLHAFLVRTGGTVISANKLLGIYRILLPEGTNIPDLAAQLANDSGITLAEPNYVYNLPEMTVPSKAATVSEWIAPSTDSPVAVAVLDSGLLAGADLGRAVISAFDATNPDVPLTEDAIGHGTLMAQLAAGQLDPYGSSVGEGVPVVAVKAFADDGMADNFTMMSAVTHAVETSSGPLSLSWGTETPSRFIESAMNYASSKGALIFAAVGNENTGAPIYPAAYKGVIGVAASDGDRLADYSNRGDFVDLVAPGSVDGSRGTSVATAYAAHVAALYMQHHPGATAADTVDAIREAVGPTGFLTAEAVRRLTAK